MITIQLKPKREENILRFHPWIFSGAIAKITGNPAEGDLVRVISANQEFLAIGHYQVGSIMVRILSFSDRPIDRSFWHERLQAAYDMRVALGLAESQKSSPKVGEVVENQRGLQTNAYRLVHGEGDNLPGLVIDI